MITYTMYPYGVCEDCGIEDELFVFTHPLQHETQHVCSDCHDILTGFYDGIADDAALGELAGQGVDDA